MKPPANRIKNAIVVRALQTKQGTDLDVFSFFIKGADIIRVADISQVERTQSDSLKGFQRPEIQSHVKSIADYLDQGEVLFPNAIILAMSPDVRFSAARGTKPAGDEGVSQAGTLTIPLYEEGKRVAWIVDGQQRSLALSRAKNRDLPVPVIAFVSDSLEVQREQFVLVNKAKPLPTRLINELLPETRSILLPRELNLKRTPSTLCNALNQDSESPFYKLIRRPSDKGNRTAVVTDTAVVKMIYNSIHNPLGALSPYRAIGREGGDTAAMYSVLLNFWKAVKNVFPEAWGRDPRESRLMHSAGIEAMGVLMDRIFARISGEENSYDKICEELNKVAPACRWTSGTWDSLGLAWNEIQSTPRDIRKLQTALVRAYTSSLKQ